MTLHSAIYKRSSLIASFGTFFRTINPTFCRVATTIANVRSFGWRVMLPSSGRSRMFKIFPSFHGSLTRFDRKSCGCLFFKKKDIPYNEERRTSHDQISRQRLNLELTTSSFFFSFSPSLPSFSTCSFLAACLYSLYNFLASNSVNFDTKYQRLL